MSQELSEMLQRCTVKLNAPGGERGTGFLVSPGVILTCAHVVKSLETYPASVCWQSRENFAQARIDCYSEEFDIALLNFEPPSGIDLPCVYLGNDYTPLDDLYIYGYPDDFPQGASVTVECEGAAHENGKSLVKFKAGQIRPGYSGSPLLNLRTGRVCGVVKFTRDRGSALGGGAVPTEVVLENFTKLAALQAEFHRTNPSWVSLLQSLEQIRQPDFPAQYAIPRSRTPQFVGRESEIQELHELLQRNNVVAITEVVEMDSVDERGGVGKTELAIQYCQRYQNYYQNRICWFLPNSPSNTEGLSQMVLSLIQLTALNIPNFNLPKDLNDVSLQARYCWNKWSSSQIMESSTPILFIFDGINNFQEIESYIPQHIYGFKTLITMRQQSNSSIVQLPIGGLPPEASSELLQALIGTEKYNEDANFWQKFAEWVKHSPLKLHMFAGRGQGGIV